MKEVVSISDLDPGLRKKMVMNCTFFNQSFMSFMMLILEDRAVYNLEQLSTMIKASDLLQNKKVKDLYDLLMQSHSNPKKRGIIVRYQDKRSKMLTFEELCVLADVVEVYDKTIQIQNRILVKKVKEYVINNFDFPEAVVRVITQIVICIICCDMVEMYYKSYEEQDDYIQIRFRGKAISSYHFTTAIALLDNLAFSITGETLSFKLDETFDKAYIAYINTIVNNKRMMDHYNRIGINDSIDIKVEGHPEAKIVFQHTNINV